jgi:polyhydroxybutyrate depolymerase
MRPGDHYFKMDFGNIERKYLVYIPQGYAGGNALPVVVMIHGAGGTSEWTMHETGWDDKADKEGFLVVFPDGVPVNPSKPPKFMTNPQLWNDGSLRSASFGRDIDDMGFLVAMLDDLEKRFTIDRKRIYFTGFSNGASMTFRAGAELSQRVAAIAPVAGHCWLKDPKPDRPIPTVFMVGDQDPLVPFEGGDFRSPWLRRIERQPPVLTTIDKWAAAIGCAGDFHPMEHDTKFRIKRRYGPTPSGGELQVYVIRFLGHHWPGGKAGLSERIGGKPSNAINATDVIWEFFAQHPLP